MTTIHSECARRNIDCLFHFTPVDHLDSILRRGLLVPSACAKQATGMKPNDTVRYDRQDAICLTVEWPNYKVFYPFRQKDTRPWAVIAVQHRVLWEKRVCFNKTNAADNSMSGQSFEARQGLAKFLELFGDCCGKIRADLKITDNFPTNPQAEVLCLDTIEPSYFMAVLLDNREAYERFKPAYPNVDIRLDDYYHSPRLDYEHWR